MDWIKIENKVPEFDERVIVSNDNHTTIAKLSHIDSKGCAWEKDCSFSFISGQNNTYRGVTKWMPLPK